MLRLFTSQRIGKGVYLGHGHGIKRQRARQAMP
jgi:hypothetical protein